MVKQFFQYPNTDARKLLSDKISAKSSFTGDELQKISDDVKRGLGVMHQNGVTHGDISPKYIGYDAKNNNYMLMDRFGSDKPLEKLQSEYIIGNQDFYMSPAVYSKI